MRVLQSICIALLAVCVLKIHAGETNCVTLGTNNARFCEVTKFWQPRAWVVDQDYAFFKIVFLPALCALFVYIVGFIYSGKRFVHVYQQFKNVIEDIPNDTDIYGFFQSKIFPRLMSEEKNKRLSFVLYWFGVPVLNMLYDVVDVAFDCYYFWQIENVNNSIVSDKIYRNVNVNNGIFAFAILGAVKSILLFWVLKVFIDKLELAVKELKKGSKGENRKILTILKEKHIFLTEPVVPAVVMLFEDAMELHFQYHFVDRYITDTDTIVVINATFMAIKEVLLLLMCIKSFYEQFKKCCVNKSWKLMLSYITFYGHILFFAIATLTRACQVLSQKSSGEINPNCLKVEFDTRYNVYTGLKKINGRLMQTPFGEGCSNKGDNLILAMMSISLSYGGISLMAFIIVQWLRYKNRMNPEHSMQGLEESIAERTTIYLDQAVN